MKYVGDVVRKIVSATNDMNGADLVHIKCNMYGNRHLGRVYFGTEVQLASKLAQQTYWLLILKYHCIDEYERLLMLVFQKTRTNISMKEILNCQNDKNEI